MERWREALAPSSLCPIDCVLQPNLNVFQSYVIVDLFKIHRQPVQALKPGFINEPNMLGSFYMSPWTTFEGSMAPCPMLFLSAPSPWNTLEAPQWMSVDWVNKDTLKGAPVSCSWVTQGSVTREMVTEGCMVCLEPYWSSLQSNCTQPNSHHHCLISIYEMEKHLLRWDIDNSILKKMQV